MEVHHHSHTSDPDPSTSSGHRGGKKWTHYLWEFLMPPRRKLQLHSIADGNQTNSVSLLTEFVYL